MPQRAQRGLPLEHGKGLCLVPQLHGHPLVAHQLPNDLLERVRLWLIRDTGNNNAL